MNNWATDFLTVTVVTVADLNEASWNFLHLKKFNLVSVYCKKSHGELWGLLWKKFAFKRENLHVHKINDILNMKLLILLN